MSTTVYLSTLIILWVVAWWAHNITRMCPTISLLCHIYLVPAWYCSCAWLLRYTEWSISSLKICYSLDVLIRSGSVERTRRTVSDTSAQIFEDNKKHFGENAFLVPLCCCHFSAVDGTYWLFSICKLLHHFRSCNCK